MIGEDDWLINSMPRLKADPACQVIQIDSDACAPCPLNRRNLPAPSARMRFLYQLEALQSAGAIFHFNDLPPEDWRDLLILKIERQKFEREKWKNKKR